MTRRTENTLVVVGATLLAACIALVTVGLTLGVMP